MPFPDPAGGTPWAAGPSWVENKAEAELPQDALGETHLQKLKMRANS